MRRNSMLGSIRSRTKTTSHKFDRKQEEIENQNHRNETKYKQRTELQCQEKRWAEIGRERKWWEGKREMQSGETVRKKLNNICTILSQWKTGKLSISRSHVCFSRKHVSIKSNTRQRYARPGQGERTIEQMGKKYTHTHCHRKISCKTLWISTGIFLDCIRTIYRLVCVCVRNFFL